MTPGAVAPGLSVSVSADPVTASGTGQRVTYAVVVTNDGGSVLTDVVAAAVGRGLPALTCAPVVQGGTLTVGSSTTCTASRTTDQDYLHTYGDRLTAVARGVAADGTVATGTGSVRTTASTPAPTATDDTVTVVSGATSVILPGSTNDHPGAPDGAALDLAGATFPRQEWVYVDGAKSAQTPYGTFQAMPDGTVRFAVTNPGGSGGGQQAITYRTVDIAGHSDTSTLTVVFLRGPKTVAHPDQHTNQGDAIAFDPLKDDVPGVDAAGKVVPFSVSSLRFPADQVVGASTNNPYPVDYADVASDGKSMRVAFRGTFTIQGSSIVFTPDPGFDSYLTIVYEVSDTAGRVVRGSVLFNVLGSVPTLTPDTGVTTYGRAVVLDPLVNDKPGVAGHTLRVAGFDDAGHTFAGTTLVTPEGTWSLDPAGRPTFTPADGFAGTASVEYAVDEVTATGTVLGFPQPYLNVWGGRYTSTIAVSVRKGPTAKTGNVVLAPHDGSGTVDPTGFATPSTHLDGSAGRFVVNRTVFPTYGQPAGSQVDSSGRTIVLASGGKLTVSSTTGDITYTPVAGFVGFDGTVVYRLQDDTTGPDGSGGSVLVRLGVVSTGAVPVATDDDATTLPAAPVRLAGATNDARGSSTSLAVDFPGSGQPTGATVSSGGATLTVPEEGTWSVAADGSVTFAPVAGFVDGASPVVYRVRGSSGTATARLSVAVLRPPAARPDAVTLASFRPTWVDPVANDVPGRDADGTLGTIDRASLRFPKAGQPAGTTVSADGKDLDVAAQGGLPQFSASVYFKSGAVIFGPDSSAFRGVSPSIRYEVQALTVDSTGKTVRTTISSTFRATFTGRDALARDDSATVPADTTATLYPTLNDVPSAYLAGLDSATFPTDQEGHLPPGSKVSRGCYDPEDGCQGYYYTVEVPGEGTWSTSLLDDITFTPEPGFVGTTSPVQYEEGDAQGAVRAFLTVTVLPPGTVRPDVATTPQGVPVSVDLVANDTPARTADGTVQSPDPDRIVWARYGQPKGSVVDAGGDLVVPKQGRYVLDRGTTRVTFEPNPTWRGKTSSVYVALSTSAYGDRDVERLQVTVTHVDPQAAPDEATTTGTTPVTVAVLDNDDPGRLALPLVPSSLRLRGTPGLPKGSSVTSGNQLLTVVGRGTFAVAGDGTVTFYPLPGPPGTLPPVDYDVADVNGTRTPISTVTVRVKGSG